MSAIINGDSPSVTFSDGTTQATSAIVSGYVPYANLPAGSVLQVINATTSTQTTSATNTYVDSNLTASITPKFSSSKIYVMVSMNGVGKQTSDTSVALRLLRGASVISIFTTGTVGYNNTTAPNFPGTVAVNWLDSPATTSSTTYKVQFCSNNNNATVYVQNASSTSTITLMEIAA